MKPLHYKIIHRNGKTLEIAHLYRNEEGKFVFEYNEIPPSHQFPGFDASTKKFESNTLWQQISFRIPDTIREKYPSVPSEELLAKTGGKLVTDHFEFIVVE